MSEALDVDCIVLIVAVCMPVGCCTCSWAIGCDSYLLQRTRWRGGEANKVRASSKCAWDIGTVSGLTISAFILMSTHIVCTRTQEGLILFYLLCCVVFNLKNLLQSHDFQPMLFATAMWRVSRYIALYRHTDHCVPCCSGHDNRSEADIWGNEWQSIDTGTIQSKILLQNNCLHC